MQSYLVFLSLTWTVLLWYVYKYIYLQLSQVNCNITGSFSTLVICLQQNHNNNLHHAFESKVLNNFYCNVSETLVYNIVVSLHVGYYFIFKSFPQNCCVSVLQMVVYVYNDNVIVTKPPLNSLRFGISIALHTCVLLFFFVNQGCIQLKNVYVRRTHLCMWLLQMYTPSLELNICKHQNNKRN